VHDTDLNQSVCSSSVTSPQPRRSSSEQHVYGATDNAPDDIGMDTDDDNDSDISNTTATITAPKRNGKGKAKVNYTLLCIVHNNMMP
jgi:hypothetical protein